MMIAACDRVFGVDFQSPDASFVADADPSGCLRDTFHDGAIDSLKWTVADPDNTPIAVLERDGQLAVSLAPAPDPSMYTFNALVSRQPWDLTGGFAIVEVPRAVVAGGAENFFLLIAETTTGINQYAINVGGGGSLGFAMWVDGVRMLSSRGYTLDDRWWRISHDAAANEVRMQVSADNVTWSEPVVYPAQVPVTNLWLALGGGTFQIRNPDPGAALFDNVQLVTAACPYLP